MNIIKAHAERLKEPDLLKRVETAGRTCYKSESNITDESAIGFVNQLIDRTHFAMLEHGEVTIVCHLNEEYGPTENMLSLGYHIPYSREGTYDLRDTLDGVHTYGFLTLSLRHVFDESMKVPSWLTEPLKYAVMNRKDPDYEHVEFSPELVTPFTCTVVYNLEHYLHDLYNTIKSDTLNQEVIKTIWRTHSSYSFKFVTDRGVSHEIVRSRVSFAQESTRYCNYSKDKFGNELTFVYPSTWDEWPEEAKNMFLLECRNIESSYMRMLNLDLKPQQARAILCNALKTEIIMTACHERWEHFFDIRVKGTTGAPHPDMKFVASIAYEQYLEAEEQAMKYIFRQEK